MNISESTINIIASGLFTIIGVLIGSCMSRNAAKQSSKKQHLLDAYTAFFSAAYWVINETTNDSLHEVVSSAERLRLLCSQASEKQINAIIRALICKDAKTSMNEIARLRELAKKDLGD